MGKEIPTLQVSFCQTVMKRKYNQWNLEIWITRKISLQHSQRWKNHQCHYWTAVPQPCCAFNKALRGPFKHSLLYWTSRYHRPVKIEEKEGGELNLVLAVLTPNECWKNNIFFSYWLLKSFLKNLLDHWGYNWKNFWKKHKKPRNIIFCNTFWLKIHTVLY